MTNIEKIRTNCVSEGRARRMLHALEDLLELYRKHKEHSISCPLCPVVDCDRCPWRLFTGRSCGGYRDRYFPKYLFIYHNYPIIDDPIIKAWRKRRLRQLSKWIKYYEQALANWNKK